ncbi:MAG: PFL_4669 family integrating conjugative element protein [Pseudomonadota bacterium]
MSKNNGDLHDLSEEEFDAIFFADDDEKPKRPVHEDNADPLVIPNLVSKRPGMLRTRGEIIIHTRSAHRLFYGRRKDVKKGIKPITGLVRFALNMNQLSELAAQDDPYADAVLLKVEQKLAEVEKLIKGHVAAVEELLSDMEGISISFHESVEPVSVPLEFKTTYGFIAARLLGQYDKLVRLAQSAMHVGLFFQEDWARIVRKSGSSMRNVFWISSSYRYTGVKRDDIAANNGVAREAIAKYGELPQAILEGAKRGKYAPQIISRSQNHD